MEHILDKTGLTYLWGKIKALFATKEEVIRNRCPYFYGIENVDEEDITSGYSEDSDYTDCYVVFNGGNDQFLFVQGTSYYTHWEAFDVYSDCTAYNDYYDNFFAPKVGVYYNYDSDGLFYYDATGFYEEEAQVQANWSTTNSSDPSYIQNKPTIPDAQIQSDWNQTNTSSKDYIKNKPDIASIISDVEDLDDAVYAVENRKTVIRPITSVITTAPSSASTDSAGAFTEIVLCTANNQIYAKKNDVYYTRWGERTVSNIFYYNLDSYRTTPFNNDNTIKPALYHLVGTNTIYNYKTSSTYDVIDLRCQADWNQSTNTAQDYIKNKPNLATVATSDSYNDLSNKPTIPTVPTNVSAFTNDAGYLTSHQDINGKEDKMTISTASGSTLSASVNTYYRFTSSVGTLAITLPVPSDTSHISSIVFYMTTASSTAVTFTSSATIHYQSGYAVSANKTYEINALYNGAAWVVMANEVTLSS